jgi:ATP-dependent helicase/nuclease subunit A
MKRSPEQCAAINTVGQNIILSASAGAGKTTVLIARLMKRILEDGVNVDEILAMTFTDLAATEMKKRLAKALQEEYLQNHDERIYRQIALLASARISTIHSFCLSLVKDYAYVLGISQKRANSISDEASSKIYQSQALDLVLDEAYKQANPSFLNLVQLLHHRPEDDTELRESILDLSSKLDAKIDPNAWLNQIKQAYRKYNHLSELDEPYRSAFFHVLQDDVTSLMDALQAFKLSLTTEELQDEEKFNILHLEDALNQLKNTLLSSDYRNFHQALINLGNLQAKTLRGLEENTKNKRDDFYASVKKVVTSYFKEEDYLSDIEYLSEPISALIDCVIHFNRVYQSIKEEAQVLDFSDMEKMALQILKHPDFDVSDQLRNQIKDILVDEFQDSNEVQDELVECISRGNNVFRVGDVKQSIYRFRNARPQLMKRLIDSKQPNDLTLYLSNNYRSKESIVEFNNQLFSNLMNVKGLDSSYADKDTVKIGVDSQKGGETIGLHLINDFEDKDEESIKLDRIKANHIAQTIISMRNEKKYPKWKDYVVLVKSHRTKLELKKAFDAYHIPNFIDVKAGFYLSSSVQDVLQVLRFCLDPRDDLSLVGVLLSSFFEFDENKLAQLRIQSPYSIVDGFKINYPKEYNALMDLTQQANILRLSEFLNILYEFNGYYTHHIDTQQRTNLDLLRVKAINLDEENFSLIEFIQMVEAIQDEKTSEAIPVSQEDDVVKVLTIHQSKGLEWPVVFVLGTKQFKNQNSNSLVHYDNDIGIAMTTILLPERYKRDNPMSLAINHKILREEKEEALRVWYVALTRAEKKLIIVDKNHKNLDKETLNLDLILGSRGYTFLTFAASKKIFDIFEIKEIDPTTIESHTMPTPPPTPAFTFTPTTQESIVFRRPSAHVFKSTITNLDLDYYNDGKERGTRLHRIIEQLPLHDWSKELILHLDPNSTSEEIEALLSFYHSDWYTTMKEIDCYKEFPFVYQSNNEIVRGIMDIMANDDKCVYCIDFKTDRHLSEQELIDVYSSQLYDYRIALKLVYPNHTIRTGIYSFRYKKVIEID